MTLAMTQTLSKQCSIDGKDIIINHVMKNKSEYNIGSNQFQ